MADPRPVLVVDDDDGIREIVSMTLADEGYVVAAAEAGDVALELVRAGPPRLVLLDIHMPRLDGFGFAEEYRRLPPPHAPVIVMTAGAEAAAKARELGAAGYLGKPFDLERLLHLVERHAGPA